MWGHSRMKVTVNGKSAEIDAQTIQDLLQARKIEAQMVAVELNEKMVERAEFGNTKLHEGDRIELHYFMGGGTAFS
jgi:thiamine biosynthesis protein ThiS